MTEPRTTDRGGLIEFLGYCVDNDNIDMWNKWREANPNIRIDLTKDDIINTNLKVIQAKNLNLSDTGIELFSTINNISRFDSLQKQSELTKKLLSKNDITGMINRHMDTISDAKIGLGGFASYYDKGNIEKETLLSQKLKSVTGKLKELESASVTERENASIEIDKFKAEKIALEENIKENEKAEEKKSEALRYISDTPSVHLDNIRFDIANRIKFFNIIGIIATGLSSLVFLAGLILILAKIIDLPNNAFEYLIYIFTVLFPMLVAFMAYRQSNIKYKDLEAINDKILNAANLEGSLNAINSLSPSDKANENMLKIIEKFAERSIGLMPQKDDKDDNKEDVGTLVKLVEALVKQSSK